MKKCTCLTLSAISLLIIACHSKGNPGDRIKKLPKPATIVDSAEMPVKEDKLNDFTYSIKIIADSDIADGVYDVAANYEYHPSDGSFTMPKGCEDFKPLIHKGKEPYTYIIGFQVPGDTAFHEYFQVQATSSHIRMQYIKGYSFE